MLLGVARIYKEVYFSEKHDHLAKSNGALVFSKLVKKCQNFVN